MVRNAAEVYPTPRITNLVSAEVADGEFTEEQLAKVFDIAWQAAWIGHADGWSSAMAKASTLRHAKPKPEGPES
ncbi:hypothetical protein OR221_0811 [Microbacterium laevaniformans OR221]|nr:hypothetical protein OR221_0811 [Microbacterium laevaniformans OR221]